MATETRFLDLIQSRKRGRFKLYLGMAAGVGKTYRMLQEAQNLLKRGVDVKLAVVVTHNRPETVQMAQGLPVIPERSIFYKGRELTELDLDAVIRLQPEVVVIDELAHTNVPGLNNEKRWQDVEYLLEQGMNVISAMNIQHLESLNSVVEQITGIKVTETVPDRVVQLADEVVNIDIPADDLIQRLREGKIYAADKVETALRNFFQEDNLQQLRELALREATGLLEQRLDVKLTKEKRVPGQRICLCVSTNDASAKRMIRKVARIFDASDGKWFTVYIQTPREAPEKIALDRQRHLLNNFKLATELGSEVVTLKGEKVAETLIQFCSERNVTLLIVGKTQRSWAQRLLKGDLMADLIAQTLHLDLDIYIIH
jgi:two-component system, OmpR family, sensor histidine kinase KdpD